MVLEKLLGTENFKVLFYIVMGLIEILGLALLISKEKTIKFIKNYYILISVIIMVFGYIGAVSVRLI